MYTSKAEKHFEAYLESHSFDEAEGLLLTIVRKAWLAGWQAASAQAASPEEGNEYAPE